MKTLKTLLLVALILVSLNVRTEANCGVIYPCFAPTQPVEEPLITDEDILDAKLWLIQNTVIYLP